MQVFDSSHCTIFSIPDKVVFESDHCPILLIADILDLLMLNSVIEELLANVFKCKAVNPSNFRHPTR